MELYCSECKKRELTSTRKSHCDCGGLWKLDFKPPKFDLNTISKWAIALQNMEKSATKTSPKLR